MDLFGSAYLKTLKERVRQEAPSRALIDALKELQRINNDQTRELQLCRNHIEALKQENTHLLECLQHLNQDHQQYRLAKENRQKRSLATQVELRREIERLENECARLLSEVQGMGVYQESALLQPGSQKSSPSCQNAPLNSSRNVDTSRMVSESSKSIVEDVLELERQLIELTEENQRLTRTLLSSGSEEVGDIRSQMRNNNRQIARLKTLLLRYKSQEQTYLEHTSR